MDGKNGTIKGLALGVISGLVATAIWYGDVPPWMTNLKRAWHAQQDNPSISQVDVRNAIAAPQEEESWAVLFCPVLSVKSAIRLVREMTAGLPTWLRVPIFIIEGLAYVLMPAFLIWVIWLEAFKKEPIHRRLLVTILMSPLLVANAGCALVMVPFLLVMGLIGVAFWVLVEAKERIDDFRYTLKFRSSSTERTLAR